MPTITRAEVSLFFTDEGGGPAIVLGHSFLCSGEMWAEQVPHLARQARVINCDLRGHGRSGHLGAPCTLRDLVDDVVAVLDHLAVERAVWAGLSIGGMVALRAALTYPERVRALAILDSHAGAETPYKRLKYRGMGLAVRAIGTRPLLPAISRLLFGRTTLARNPELVSAWKERFAAVHVPSVLRVLDALVRRDSVVDRLGEIVVPALVLVGEEDASLPLRYSREIADGLPQATYQVVPGCGHLSALEEPEAVTGALLDFLDGLPES